MLSRLKHAMMLMAIVLSIASPALAHTPPPAFASELDLRNVDAIDETEIAEPLPIIPASTFDDVARVEMPPPSILETLEVRTAAMLAHDDGRTLHVFGPNSAELASWPLASGDENNIKGERKLSLELHRATEFQALPFAEPATGLVYARARWYDPGTGSFLTPDAFGYSAGSSNLYAGFNNDPVNNIDPDGNEPVTAAAAIAYLGQVALQTAIDVGIDWAWHEGVDSWNGTDTAFDWHDSLQTNFGINLVSAGFGGKLKHLAKLRNPIFRGVAKQGAEYAVDVAATGTIDVVLHDQSATEAYGTAAIGGLIGRTAGHALRHGSGILGRYAGYRGGRGEFLEEVNEALAHRRGEDVFATQRANRTGFDLGAYADGTTFLDEVKFYNGKVRHSDVTSAGLHFAAGGSATRALRRNVGTASRGAGTAGLRDAQRSLAREQFHLRLIGGPQTTFDPFIGDLLTQRGIAHSFHRILRPQIWSYMWLGY